MLCFVVKLFFSFILLLCDWFGRSCKQKPCPGGVVDFDVWKANPVNQSSEGPSSNYGKSPFPLLEVFIEAIARIGDIQGM